jgi:hypothetical protein
MGVVVVPRTTRGSLISDSDRSPVASLFLYFAAGLMGCGADE